ncbi:peroxiredoxin [Dysgonomonas alginatilytica]|uniref:Peroxiredoxin n=1 Tax=Dysgonomonas alginatilytica TaxID=1605892 RepID=A0A2V3PMH7_9BACT|nr:TlpA disulfide reductase family protein [Dysgonomonas alginatilytica]PXV63340.1 peroxiredoxin [Dysgonomonas alginatilytica]
MKKISSLLFASIVILMAACTGKPVPEYIITGNLSGGSDSIQVYLQEIDENTGEFVSVDTATVKNGTFLFRGIAEQNPVLRFIATEGLYRPAPVVIEVGNIDVSIDTAFVVTVKGTALNDKYQEFSNKRNALNDQHRELSKLSKEAEEAGTLTPEYDKELSNKFDSLYNGWEKEVFAFTKANITNPLGVYILIDRGVAFDAAQLKELLPSLDAKVKASARMQKLEKRLQALEGTEVGKQFIDIKGTTPDGKELSLSDYAGKGKYVLIDFWASWCGPCIQDMPTVVKAYKQYKNKGFEVVGVSLDHDKTAWQKAIKDLNITWPQVSDLKGWETELGAAYAVNRIPHTVLLDKEGKIIAKDIHASELLSKLAELMK